MGKQLNRLPNIRINAIADVGLDEADQTDRAATIISEQFAMPDALQWKGVAEIIAKGLTSLPASR